MRNFKIHGLAVALLLTAFCLLPTGLFGQGQSFPVFTWLPEVSWPGTGLTLSYTTGAVYRGFLPQTIVTGTLTLTNSESTCTVVAIESQLDACNYVYDPGSGTALLSSTTYTTATTAGNTLLYLCSTTGGNITGCTDASAVMPLQRSNGATINYTVPAQAAGTSPAAGGVALGVVAGAGGAQSGTTSGGGAGGTISLTCGVGGIGGSSSGTAGAGGACNFTSGAGGAGPITGGAGGLLSIIAGVGGNGSTAGGAGGSLALAAGNAGTGGTPAGGNISITPGVPTSTGQVGEVTIVGGAGAAHVRATQTTAPAPTGTCTTPAVTTGSTDWYGQASCASSTAGQTIILTFHNPWSSAPFCTISPATAASAATTSGAAISFASASTTALTITTPAESITAPVFTYTCN